MSDQTPYSGYSDSPPWQNPPSGGYPPASGPYAPPQYSQPQPGFAPQAASYSPQAYPPGQYPQQAYFPQNQQPVFVAPSVSEPGAGMAVASLVLGILSIVTFWGWFLTLPLSIIGIIMGALGRRSISRRGIATAGLVCSIIGLVVFLLFYLLVIAAVFRAASYPY